MWADDVIAPVGWLETAFAVAGDSHGLIGLWDGHAVTHFVMHRDFMFTYLDGHFNAPYYMTWCVDNELLAIAKRANQYNEVRIPVCRQYHPAHGDAPDDNTYRACQRYQATDLAIFYDRQARGFPDEPTKYQLDGYWDAETCEVSITH
jgi:hypothetical protein